MSRFPPLLPLHPGTHVWALRSNRIVPMPACESLAFLPVWRPAFGRRLPTDTLRLAEILDPSSDRKLESDSALKTVNVTACRCMKTGSSSPMADVRPRGCTPWLPNPIVRAEADINFKPCFEMPPVTRRGRSCLLRRKCRGRLARKGAVTCVRTPGSRRAGKPVSCKGVEGSNPSPGAFQIAQTTLLFDAPDRLPA